MKDKGKIIELTLRYEAHTVSFLYNVKDIEEHKKSLDYRIFKNKFGDILRENVLIEDNKEFIQADANILLSISQPHPSKEGFEAILNQCLVLFDIPYRYNHRIRNRIINSYPKNDKTILFHNVIIINDFSQDDQYIEFYFKVLKTKKYHPYSFLSQTKVS